MQKIVKFDNFILKYLFMIIILYTFASLNNIKVSHLRQFIFHGRVALAQFRCYEKAATWLQEAAFLSGYVRD